MSVKPASEVLIDSINEALFTVDVGCRITAFNRSAEELTGFHVDEVVGRPCTEVFRSDICESNCAVKDSIRKGRRVTHRRVRMKNRDGEVIPISVSTSPIYGRNGELEGAVETIRRLSELERLNDALASETAQKQAILGSLAEGVITIDPNWKITSLNAAALRMLGVKEPDGLGRLCSEVLRTDRCEKGCPLARVLRDHIPVWDEILTLWPQGGQSLEVSLNAAVLRSPDGDVQGGVLSFRELTEAERLRSELAGEQHFQGIIGRSDGMRAVFRVIEDVAESDSTVLITGESGTGKEMVANAIQVLSGRVDAPYVKVNCGIFSEGVLESELFGHVKGAFTGAHQTRRGRFELADRGTLFLDEIGDISAAMQVKLLRVLEDHRFEPVGSETTIETDVRIIAATNQDLLSKASSGAFREDLFYRLNVIPIHIPPLRERAEDIPLLIEHFLRKYQILTGKKVQRLQGRALDLLMAQAWPGNVRQLENAIEYAFARTHGSVLTEEMFPLGLRNAMGESGPAPVGEAAHLMEALQRHHWHHGRAADALNISRTTLWRRMKQFGLLEPPGDT